ncbi:protachykinin [Pleuronectes platessa]|uniref:protachykinin n=1 Tax=Pleuronectes platessa TaxID=8262 RepID=UPI00232A3B6F|nr:protachykinin [Pleuronectes platessa]
MMEIMKLVVIVLLLLTNVFCQDVDNWRGAREENKWPNSEVIEDVFVRLIRKPGPRQYLGIMGKKYSGKMQPAGKPHKFQTFVGLMGKRSFEDDGFMGAAQRSEDY